MFKRKSNRKRSKADIPSLRRSELFYKRVILTLKLFISIFFCLLFFTGYLDFIKIRVADRIYTLTSDLGFKLENIIIEGQKNSKTSDILAALNLKKDTPVFAINLPLVKKALEQNSWIEAAAAKRKLPNTIHIYILERTPVAVWQINQNLFLIDEQGHKIQPLSPELLKNYSHLLRVVGKGANVYAAKLIDDIAVYPELAVKIKAAIRYGERRWDLELEQDITVKMPERDFPKAYKYLAELNRAAKLFDQNYKVLNFRDYNKFYIQKHQK